MRLALDPNDRYIRVCEVPGLMTYNPNARAFDWCYTFNDIPQDEQRAVGELLRLQADLDAALARRELRHYCFQLERGRKRGHLHVHLFLQFRERQRAVRFRSILCGDNPYGGRHPDIQPRLGSTERCEEYHSKEETRVDGPYFGGQLSADRQGQGQRSDLGEVSAAIKRGASARDIARDHPGVYIRYHRGVHATIDILHEPVALRSRPGTASRSLSVACFGGC